MLQLVFQLLGALEDLLRGGHVVPKVGVSGLFLQFLHFPAGAFQIQSRPQFLQLRFQSPQLLFIGIVFDDGHTGFSIPVKFQSNTILCHKALLL